MARGPHRGGLWTPLRRLPGENGGQREIRAAGVRIPALCRGRDSLSDCRFRAARCGGVAEWWRGGCRDGGRGFGPLSFRILKWQIRARKSARAFVMPQRGGACSVPSGAQHRSGRRSTRARRRCGERAVRRREAGRLSPVGKLNYWLFRYLRESTRLGDPARRAGARTGATCPSSQARPVQGRKEGKRERPLPDQGWNRGRPVRTMGKMGRNRFGMQRADNGGIRALHCVQLKGSSKKKRGATAISACELTGVGVL